MRLIDAEDLAKQEWFVGYHPYKADGTTADADKVAKEVVEQCKQLVANAPKVDAIPVVRCKDCVNATEHEGYTICDYHSAAVLPQWFCWNGERRINETD